MQNGHRRQLFPQQRGLVIPVGSRAYRRMRRKQHMVTLLLIVLLLGLSFFFCKGIQQKERALSAIPTHTPAPSSEHNIVEEPLAVVPAFARTGSYGLTIPLLRPVEGTLTSGYGQRTSPIDGKCEFHPAVDLAAPEGTPILAALDGQVEEIGVSQIYGNYIKLRHGLNLETMYSHCSSILAEQGQAVARGDAIALVGSTGRSTGNHLDFQLFIDGKNVDPAPALGLE